MAVVAIVSSGTFALARFGPPGFTLTDAARKIFPSATACPGASGPNSSWSELVDAVVDSPEFAAQLAAQQQAAAQVLSGTGATTITTASARASLIKLADEPNHFSKLVPDGGDARFAQAVCDAIAGQGPSVLAALGAGFESTVASGSSGTVIRMAGRMQCELAGSSPGEESIAPIKREAAAAAKDPAAYKARQLATLDESIRTFRGGSQTEMVRAMIDESTKARERIASTSPADLVAGLTTSQRITEAAFRYQCPSKLALGYGRTCGVITGRSSQQSSGTFTGTIHLRNDKIDCERGRAELDNWFSLAGGRSGFQGEYMCREASSGDADRKVILATCGLSGRNTKWDPKDPEGVVVARES